MCYVLSVCVPDRCLSRPEIRFCGSKSVSMVNPHKEQSLSNSLKIQQRNELAAFLRLLSRFKQGKITLAPAVRGLGIASAYYSNLPWNNFKSHAFTVHKVLDLFFSYVINDFTIFFIVLMTATSSSDIF